MAGIRQAATTAVLAAGVVVACALPASAGSSSQAAGVDAVAPAGVSAPAAVTSQYCTWSPDSWGRADFRPACSTHDRCYSPGSTTSRLVCDQQLRADLRLACSSAYQGASLRTCHGVASTYYGAVRWFGRSRYLGAGDPT